MLISQALNDKINEQVGYEFAASIQYTAIAAHFAAVSPTAVATTYGCADKS